jgi:hypothetical protein
MKIMKICVPFLQTKGPACTPKPLVSVREETNQGGEITPNHENLRSISAKTLVLLREDTN